MSKTIKVADGDHRRLQRLAREWSVKHEREITLAEVVNLLLTIEGKRQSKVSRGTK